MLTFESFEQHPHIYTNGHCCVSILSTEWSPVLNVTSVLLTMQSMLASCKKKEKPKDNDRYVKHAPISPKDTVWSFHDEYVTISCSEEWTVIDIHLLSTPQQCLKSFHRL